MGEPKQPGAGRSQLCDRTWNVFWPNALLSAPLGGHDVSAGARGKELFEHRPCRGPVPREKGRTRGSMHTIAIAVSAGAAGLVGWYSRSSSKMAALIGAAGGGAQPARPDGASAPGRTARPPPRLALERPLGIGGRLGYRHRRGRPARPRPRRPAALGRLALAVWAGALAVLALIDRESLVIPTKMVRGAILAAIALLFSGSAGAGDWRLFLAERGVRRRRRRPVRRRGRP